MSAYVAPQSPPSSYAIAGVLDGERGAWGRVARATAERSVMIAPGLWLAGIRGRELLAGAALASVSITTVLFAHYWRKKRAAASNN